MNRFKDYRFVAAILVCLLFGLIGVRPERAVAASPPDRADSVDVGATDIYVFVGGALGTGSDGRDGVPGARRPPASPAVRAVRVMPVDEEERESVIP